MTKAWCEMACCDAVTMFPAGSMPTSVDGYTVHQTTSNALGFSTGQSCNGYEWSINTGSVPHGRCQLTAYDMSDSTSWVTHSDFDVCVIFHPPSAPPPSAP